MNKPVITFDHVSKSFLIQEDRTLKDLIPSLLLRRPSTKRHQVFQDLSFVVNEGETLGIVGKNGAGKSTLLKLIANVTYPESGKVDVQGKVAPLIELGAGFHHELSGYENIFLNGAILGMHKKEIELQIDKIIAFSELEEYIHVPVKKYSSGMQMRLGFAVAIHMDVPILLIDEVLAVGDRDFQEKCISKLKELRDKHNKTIIFVSHNEDAVKSFCERAIMLEHGKIVADDEPDVVFERYNKT